MPVLATQSVELTSNDLNEQETSVQIKDVKDGKYKYFYLKKQKNFF
jgi:hypothetical protein